MYEALLDHARRSNDETLRQMVLEKQINALKSQRSFRKRLLLAISDILLAISMQIRPEELQVYHGRFVNTSKGFSDLSWR